MRGRALFTPGRGDGRLSTGHETTETYSQGPSLRPDEPAKSAAVESFSQTPNSPVSPLVARRRGAYTPMHCRGGVRDRSVTDTTVAIPTWLAEARSGSREA